MNAKHTAGPWTTLPEEVDRAYIRIRGTRLGGRYKVANVLTPAHEYVNEREAIETRANAHLIAAAPELLTALWGLINAAERIAIHGTYDVDDEPEVIAAIAAIAKATGADA